MIFDARCRPFWGKKLKVFRSMGMEDNKLKFEIKSILRTLESFEHICAVSVTNLVMFCNLTEMCN